MGDLFVAFLKPLTKLAMAKLLETAGKRDREEWQRRFSDRVLPRILEFLQMPSEEGGRLLLRDLAQFTEETRFPAKDTVLMWIRRGQQLPFKEELMTFILRKVLQNYDPLKLKEFGNPSLRGNTYQSLVADLREAYGVTE